LLTYQVTISRPDNYGETWWRVGNAGSPAQAAAALTELAARCALEPLPPAGRCWFVCDVRFADDVQVDYFVGAIGTTHLGEQLRGAAARIREVADTSSHVTHPPLPPRGTL
jgi:hypothetical protein